MPTRNVNLTDHYDRFINEQIEAGKYRNASEVFRAGLRLLEHQAQTEEQKLRCCESWLTTDSPRSIKGRV